MNKPNTNIISIYPLLTICLLIVSWSFPAVANAANRSVELGKLKSPSCQFCHVPSDSAALTSPHSGSSDPSYPNLNSQDETYLLNAMLAYQRGYRTGGLAEMMQAQLQKLNNDDLKDIAAYYSSQPN